MESSVIIQQMCVIGILVLFGVYLRKRGALTDDSSEKISDILMTFCNPALILASILSGNITATHGDLIQAFIFAFCMYSALVVLGFLVPALMPLAKENRKFYNMMIIYTNVGFIGLPVARAILPENAILYVIVCNLFYSFFFYTHGISILREPGAKFSLKKMISPGTVMSVITLVVFWYDIPLPMIISNTVIFTGNATTFLSMILLGGAITKISIKESLKDVNIWIYIIFRMILFPIVVCYFLRGFHVNEEMVQAFTLSAAMPVGNVPLIQAERIGESTDILAQGTAISTVVCLFTITLLMSILF